MSVYSIKRKVAATAIGAVALVGLAGTPAFAANKDVAIDNLMSPNNAGALENATLTWSNASTVTFVGYLADRAPDGHGPYLHFYVNRANGDTYQQYKYHNQDGTNTRKYVSGGVVDTGYQVLSVNVWVCNGGDADGNGTANGGCYGRKYYNQQLVNTGSQSLGTHASPYGG